MLILLNAAAPYPPTNPDQDPVLDAGVLAKLELAPDPLLIELF